ncbi:hypothetical protein QR680_000308 [Steinernema hermaphroditum]|uniref:BHLH domain-containing protein n=1 Tax=Steinernema hermaphroditum TaxID=289476 RepID=A0AA39GU50_9BILA|nr:hypothetical protein QR680_000308 [Steinernema hermaphroditum]
MAKPKKATSASTTPKAANQVQRRNERERRRVEQVNNGFAQLRNKVMTKTSMQRIAQGKKLSKVETLREASRYISHLSRLLGESRASEPSQPASQVSTLDFNENAFSSFDAFAYSMSPATYHPTTFNAPYPSPHSSNSSHRSDNSFEEQKYFPPAMYHS